MLFERLLAKSRPRDLLPTDPLPPSTLLPVHLADVYRAAGQVLAATADDQLSALGLPPGGYRDRLQRMVLLAAAVHDLGKANDHFQGMIQDHADRRGKHQGLRHEWVTILMLEESRLRSWLLPAIAGDETDWQITLWAVGGHHPAYNRPSPPMLPVEGAGYEIGLLMDHADFRRSLEWLGRTFNLEGPPATASVRLTLAGGSSVFATRIIPWLTRARACWRSLKEQDRRLVAAVKSCLIAGDVAGSALPQKVRDEVARETWIATAFSNTPPPGRIQRIVDRRRGPHPLYPFQQTVADSTSPVTFVRAGCGSGKTLAAYQWAATQHPSRRLYFCYPTTGTATEGYRDYLHAPEEDFDADLFHGRAAVDLDIVLGVRGDDDGSDSDSLARIESLDAWSTPIVACTVDTVLGLVQNNRRGLYAWPALAGAAFIFDECHAYDDSLFGALLRFLQALPGVPVLLMTASLPTARFEALQMALKRRGVELATIPAEPLESELYPRYHRHVPYGARDPLAEVEEEVARGGKVLWVCNIVDRAIAAWERAQCSHILRDKVSIYHSRFRYEDRVRRHKDVMEAFRSPGAALAVCTQVAEMSLDLSATLLVTELAPVPALIQRLGRLNRRARRGDATCPFLVLEPDGHLPYTPAELDTARKWLAALGPAPLSQNDLATHWAASFGGGRRLLSHASAWLDGGPATEVRELRELSQGITILCHADGAAVRNGRLHPARVALPMPSPSQPWKHQWRYWPQVKGLPVAPAEAIDYSPIRGAKWT